MNQPREILIESVPYGNSLRVTAIDAATGTEITFQAPLTTSQLAIKRLATSKIKFVLEKNAKR
jgi:hypothetical protein